jgi:pentatricopeptide repeat-containing protein PET309
MNTLFAENPAGMAERPATSTGIPDDHDDMIKASSVIGELSRAEEADQVDNLRILHRLLSTRTVTITDTDVRRVWRHFLALHPAEKRDRRLQEQLMSWFSESRQPSANHFVITLYWSIPVQARTLVVYDLAIRSFFRLRKWKYLAKLHEDAVSSLPNGEQITFRIFAYTVHTGRWTVATQVVRYLQDYCQERGQANRVELFWLRVLEIPNILSKAWSFAKWFSRREVRLGPIELDAPIVQRLAKEALKQHIQVPIMPRKPGSKRDNPVVRKLLKFIFECDKEAHHFFHEMLRDRIPHLHAPGESRLVLRQIHQLTSTLYWLYRGTPNAKLDTGLMLMFLQHLTQWMSRTHLERRSVRNVTAALVLEDWEEWHGALSSEAVLVVLRHCADSGSIERFDQWTAYLERRYPAYETRKRAFPLRIHLHSKLGDLPAAKAAFADVIRMARAYGDRPDITCWRSLIIAHQHSDDLVGAFETFRAMLLDPHLKPTFQEFKYLFHMIASKGDVNGVKYLAAQYEAIRGVSRGRKVFPVATEVLPLLVHALIVAGDQQSAEEILKQALEEGRDVKSRSFTDAFNHLLKRHAFSRDLEAAMHTYRIMKEYGVPIDAATYQHLIQVLVNLQRSDAAWSLCKKSIPKDGLSRNAKHYTLVMRGFNKTKQPQKAILAHTHMVNQNIRPNIGTKNQLFIARVHYRTRTIKNRREQAVAISREQLDILESVIESVDSRTVSNSSAETNSSLLNFYTITLWAMSKAGELDLDVASRLFEEAQGLSKLTRHSPWPQVELSIAFMAVLATAGKYEDVEARWNAIKERVDQLAPITPVPDLVAVRRTVVTIDTSPSDPPVKPDAHAEIGSKTDDGQDVIVPETPSPPKKDIASSIGPRPAPRHTPALSTAFRVYAGVLYAQGRISDLIRVFTRLMAQGYTFNNDVWNHLIQYLCSAQPPLALLAFTLSERFFAPNWRGWQKGVYPPRRSERRLGSQYVRARYNSPETLIPRYRTVIEMARAARAVRRIEAYGGVKNIPREQIDDSLRRFVGRVVDLREKTPMTYWIVRTMPKKDDVAQTRAREDIVLGIRPKRSANEEVLFEEEEEEQVPLEPRMPSDGSNAPAYVPFFTHPVKQSNDEPSDAMNGEETDQTDETDQTNQTDETDQTDKT